MKRTIAIVAGGDTSEFHVSLRSAQGIYSFIDKEKYTLYIVEMHEAEVIAVYRSLSAVGQLYMPVQSVHFYNI